MTYIPNLLVLAGVWVAMVISPGPDFAATIHYSTAGSRRDGMFVAFGITSALAIWIIGSMLGLALLLARLSWLAETLKLIGAAYLTYLGIRTFLSARKAAPVSGAETTAPLPARSASAWRTGFLSDITNPKAVVFFSSLFVALLPAHPPIWLQVASVLLMLCIAAGWYCIVACIFSLAPVSRFYRRAKRWVDYVTGGVFVALGIDLALKR